jgi:hypothetical protein
MDYQAIDTFMKKNGLDKDPAFENLHFLNEPIPSAKNRTILGLYFPEGSEPHHEYGFLPPSTIVLPEDADTSTLLHELGHRHGHFYHNDISEPYAEEYRKLHEGQMKIREPAMRTKEDSVCDYCQDSKNGRQNCPWCEYGKTAIPKEKKSWAKVGQVAAREAQSRVAASESGTSFVVNGQDGIPAIAVGATVSAVLWVQNIDTVAHRLTYVVQRGYDGTLLGEGENISINPGQYLSFQMNTFTMSINDTIGLDYTIFMDGVQDSSGTWSFQVAGKPVVAFTINGVPALPGVTIRAGSTVSTDMTVKNIDSQLHNIRVSLYEGVGQSYLTLIASTKDSPLGYNGGPSYIGTYYNNLGGVAAGQTSDAGVIKNFTMPNTDDSLSYGVWVDGIQVETGSVPITVQAALPTQYTNISSLIANTAEYVNSVVTFTFTIVNTTASPIQVQATAQFGTIDATIVNPTAPLAAGASKTFTGTFTMPAADGTLVVTSSVQVNGTYQQDKQATQLISLVAVGTPTLTLAATSINQGQSLSFTISGFLPLTQVNVVVNGTIANEHVSVEADASGNGSGTITPGDVAGDYTIQAVGINGSSPAVAFTIVWVMPAGFTQVMSTTYPAQKTYSGPAQKVIGQFTFLPANWPGAKWYINKFFDQKMADEITKAGDQPLTMELYENGFSYIIIFTASYSAPAARVAAQFDPLSAAAIIAACIALIVIGILITVTIISITHFIEKAPAAAIATGLIILGIAGVAVVGLAIYKGTSVKKAITG